MTHSRLHRTHAHPGCCRRIDWSAHRATELQRAEAWLNAIYLSLSATASPRGGLGGWFFCGSSALPAFSAAVLLCKGVEEGAALLRPPPADGCDERLAVVRLRRACRAAQRILRRRLPANPFGPLGELGALLQLACDACECNVDQRVPCSLGPPASIACCSVSMKRCESSSGREQQSQEKTFSMSPAKRV